MGIVVLTQKIEGNSTYNDELFKIYHFPYRYRSTIKEGDVFIYYNSGNELKNEERFYYGTGLVGKITATDHENYYAELIECKSFSNKVPIHLPSGEYVEQMGNEEKRSKPPWQSSIRIMSKLSYEYILSHAGEMLLANGSDSRFMTDETAVLFIDRTNDNHLDLEGEMIQVEDNAFEDEVANLENNRRSILEELNEAKKNIPYPNVDKYDASGDYYEIADLNYKKNRNKPYWEIVENLTKYDECSSLYVGHLTYKSGSNYYVCDNPKLESRTLKNGAKLINADDRDHIEDVNSWRFPDEVSQVSYSSNIDIINRQVQNVEVKIDKTNELYANISDSYLRNALIRNKSKLGIQSIIQTIQDKQNMIRSLDADKRFVVQGCAGSGKTMVLLHRLRYLIYNRDILASQYVILTPNEGLKTTIHKVSGKFNFDSNKVKTYFGYYKDLLGRARYEVGEENELVFSYEFLTKVYSKEFIRQCYKTLLKDISIRSENLIEDSEDILNELINEESKSARENVEKIENECLERWVKERLVLEKLGINVAGYFDIKNALGEMKTKLSNANVVSKDVSINPEDIIIDRDDVRFIENEELSFIKGEIDSEKKLIEKASFFTANSHRRKLEQLEKKYSELYKRIEQECVDEEYEKLKELENKSREIFDGLSLEAFEMIVNQLDEVYNQAEATIEEEQNKIANLEEYLGRKYSKEIDALNDMIEASEQFLSNCEPYIEKLEPAFDYNLSNRGTQLITKSIVEEYINKASILLGLMSSHASGEMTKKIRKEYAIFAEKTPAQLSAYITTRLFNIMKKEIREEFDKKINPVYKHYWYLNLYANYLTRSYLDSHYKYIFIDEAQDLSSAEIDLIEKINTEKLLRGNGVQINRPIVNLFGDTSQLISPQGITAWDDVDCIDEKYLLDENFRNTNQIIDYCNNSLSITMKKVGVDLDEVKTYSSLQNAGKRESLANKTFVVKNEYALEDLKSCMKLMKITNCEMYTVKGVKGLEFKEVYVIDRDMTTNEKYISYTRALQRLIVINDMPRLTDASKDLAIDGEDEEDNEL